MNFIISSQHAVQASLASIFTTKIIPLFRHCYLFPHCLSGGGGVAACTFVTHFIAHSTEMHFKGIYVCVPACSVRIYHSSVHFFIFLHSSHLIFLKFSSYRTVRKAFQCDLLLCSCLLGAYISLISSFFFRHSSHLFFLTLSLYHTVML
jgi:hypothetical protein